MRFMEMTALTMKTKILAEGDTDQIEEPHLFLSGVIKTQVVANPYFIELVTVFPVKNPMVKET